MAKACAYLCRQCCFIDGFGEFGEFLVLYCIVLLYYELKLLRSTDSFRRDLIYGHQDTD